MDQDMRRTVKITLTVVATLAVLLAFAGMLYGGYSYAMEREKNLHLYGVANP